LARGSDPTSDPEVLATRQAWFEGYVRRLENDAIVAPPELGPYRCPCCHYLTLRARSRFEICPVCSWEDDGQDDPHAEEVWYGPNKSLSLTDARLNFIRIGASDERRLKHVRPPLLEES
jgi:hypothetical protein